VLIQEQQGPKVSPEVLGDFLDRLQQAFEKVVKASPSWGEVSSQLFLMVNPAAGKIHSSKERTAFIKALELVAATLSPQEKLNENQTNRVHVIASHEPGELVRRAHDLSIQGALGIFVSFGGDGTHQEVLNGITERGVDTRLCRYPMGTGNDGVDVTTPEDLVQIVFHGPKSSGRNLEAVRVTTSRGFNRLSGNITGVGMDAYIGFLSQKYKKTLPGKAYKIAADLGVLFYRKKYDLRECTVVLQALDESTKEVHLIPGIMCFGASGTRTYGMGIPILPSKENVCLIPMGSLGQNLALKSLLYKAEHVKNSRVQMHEARKLEVHYDALLPMQMDGEIAWLEPEDFPLVFERIQLLPRIL
jgi:diacylglycerol kinase family enzyme